MANLNVQQWISSAMTVLQAHRTDINTSIKTISQDGSQIVATTHAGQTQTINLPTASDPLTADSGVSSDQMMAL